MTDSNGKTYSIKLQVKFAWWFKPYIKALMFVSLITGLEPDEAKLQRAIKRAVSVKASRSTNPMKESP